MLYELTENEIQHIMKYRKLFPGDREVFEELLDRMVELNAKLEQAMEKKGIK